MTYKKGPIQLLGQEMEKATEKAADPHTGEAGVRRPLTFLSKILLDTQTINLLSK